MKQLFSKITSICFALAMISLSVVPAFADDTTAKAKDNGELLNINGDADVAVGETVTYTLYLSDATDPIVGFEMRLFYDSDFLEYQKSSLKFEKFEVVIYNEDLDGKIPMNYSGISNKPDFSKKGQFVSADFKVKKAGEAGITYFFTELYGDDMSYLKNFTFTYDLTVNDKAVVSDAVPPVNTNEEIVKSNQGDFINYADGKGDNNGSADGSHEAIVDKQNSLSPYYEESVIEITRSVGGSNGGKNGLSGGWIFLLIAIPVVIAAVIVAVVLVNKKGKNSIEETEVEAAAEDEPENLSYVNLPEEEGESNAPEDDNAQSDE